MAIDYIVDYPCPPKQAFGSAELIARLKGQARAEEVIQWYRDHNDTRPTAQMGFDWTYTTPTGETVTELVLIQDLLDAYAELLPLAPHCQHCPANHRGKPFGCVGAVQYPITQAGEAWLLAQLPSPQDTLVWLLLKQGVEQFAYDGQITSELRTDSEAYFEARRPSVRHLGEFSLDANQVFEMVFAVGDILPNHAGVLLLFFHAIPRDLDATTIMHLTPAGADFQAVHPFLPENAITDDESIRDLKHFLRAVYTAWGLNVPLGVDA